MEREFNVEGIKKIIPHREPFLMIDSAKLSEDLKSVTGYKVISGQEDFFKGHFPGKPIMPGVLITECMAQTACVLFLAMPEVINTLPYFMTIEKAKFRKPVFPPSTIESKIQVIRSKGRSGKVRGESFVNGVLVAEAEFMFMLVDR